MAVAATVAVAAVVAGRGPAWPATRRAASVVHIVVERRLSLTRCRSAPTDA
ncbi:hypothetical protein DM77_2471 [Burkholderia mallei]|nr:hypothetical protein DM77_2471 [Burkholderia mallei]